MSLVASAELSDQIERDQLQAAGALIWEFYGQRRVSDEEAGRLQECLEHRRGRGGQRRGTQDAPIAPLRGRVNKYAPRRHQRSPDRAASRARRTPL